MTWFSGIATFSRISSAVSDERIPSFPWIARWLKPGVPFSIRNAVIPF